MAMQATSRPDLAAHEDAMRLDFPVLVKELKELLGPKLVAYVAGVRETRTVREWAEGAKVKSTEVEPRLRMTYRVARLIADHDGPSITQSWFQGLNPQLEECSPARLLREEDLDESGPKVLAAARAFVVGG